MLIDVYETKKVSKEIELPFYFKTPDGKFFEIKSETSAIKVDSKMHTLELVSAHFAIIYFDSEKNKIDESEFNKAFNDVIGVLKKK